MADSRVVFNASVASRAALPSLPACLTAKQKSAAANLCAQSRSSGQYAVAAFGVLGAVDPLTKEMSSNPCGWAALPLCAVPEKPPLMAPGSRAAPSALSPEVAALRPPPLPTPRASNTPLIVGATVAGMLVIAGVVYFTTRKAS